jgi:hypothetical protein
MLAEQVLLTKVMQEALAVTTLLTVEQLALAVAVVLV